MCNPVYSTAFRYVHFLSKFNVDVTFVPAGCDVEEYRKAVKPNTRVLYGETPGNPLLSILDLEAFGRLGQELGILTMVDATLASPYCVQPIRHGVDVCMHSAYVH